MSSSLCSKYHSRITRRYCAGQIYLLHHTRCRLLTRTSSSKTQQAWPVPNVCLLTNILVARRLCLPQGTETTESFYLVCHALFESEYSDFLPRLYREVYMLRETESSNAGSAFARVQLMQRRAPNFTTYVYSTTRGVWGGSLFLFEK